MDAIDALLNRTSWARLEAPVPDAEQRDILFRAALRAPDHGLLRPWKFITVEGDARARLGEVFVEALKPEEGEKREKLRNAPLRAPLIIVVAATFKYHPKVPQVEQIGSAAAACQNISLAAYAMGYATIWRTGEPAFNGEIKKALGLAETDELVGYIYIGTPTVTERKVPEVDPADFVTAWNG